jgi:hypothetical protein
LTPKENGCAAANPTPPSNSMNNRMLLITNSELCRFLLSGSYSRVSAG